MGPCKKEVTEKIVAQRKAAGEKAKKEGEEFLAKNKAKDGVKTLPSGLQYKVLAEGKGTQPKPTDQVTVNYRGTLVDGTEFDNSYKRGQPATFPVNQVIKGWTESVAVNEDRGEVGTFRARRIGLWRTRRRPRRSAECDAHLRGRNSSV